MPAPDEEFKKAFGVRLQQLRRDAGVPQESVAHLAGMSVSTLSRLELGKIPGINTSRLPSLALALGVRVEDLFKDL